MFNEKRIVQLHVSCLSLYSNRGGEYKETTAVGTTAEESSKQITTSCRSQYSQFDLRLLNSDGTFFWYLVGCSVLYGTIA